MQIHQKPEIENFMKPILFSIHIEGNKNEIAIAILLLFQEENIVARCLKKYFLEKLIYLMHYVLF